MTKPAAPKFVTFIKWCLDRNGRTPVTINAAEVSNIEDYCGSERPGSMITLKNKKSYLVWGAHADIIAKLKGE